ncbi:MAG: hypothetical protein J5534_09805 [Fibrobacter sp.]|nr:hypothetical protein [Fibrobacter sp.]
MSEKTFKFYIGDESRVVIEDSEKMEESIFGEVYAQAFNALDDFLGNIKVDKSVKDFDDDCLNCKKGVIQKNTPRNNIFAFVGDRGTGKTSCMMSFAKMLQENKQTLPNIQEKKFEVLESTDPSFFTETKNIVEIFVGRLFSRFKEEVEDRQNVKIDKENEKNHVFEAFEHVKESLTCMNKKELCDEDTVEQLMGLGASVELQESIHELIRLFLKYVHKDFLVIPVDDIDLHSVYAFEMAEQIRKYLVQDNTIVLMALRIEQMQSSIERHYVEHYEPMLKNNVPFDKNEIITMASKYLVKFIPVDRRFRLKNVEEISNDCVDIIDERKSIRYNDASGKTLKEKILYLIKEKTGVHFKYEHKNFPLIPDTLRELRNLIIYIYRMPKSNLDKIQKNNRMLLWRYISNEWANSYCGKSGPLLNVFGGFPAVSGFNKFVVLLLADFWLLKKNNVENSVVSNDKTNDAEINRIINKENKNDGISIGDVLAFIHYVESVEYDRKKHNFLFGLRFLYSLMLRKEHYAFSDKEKQNNDYAVFIGNNFVNPNDVSNWLKNAVHRFDCVAIPLKKIRELEADSAKLRVVEFFALSLDREFFASEDDQYRKKATARMTGQSYRDDSYVYFNVFSIFSNLLDIDGCYNRFSLSLLKKVEKDDNSLYSILKKLNYNIKDIDEIEDILGCTKEIDLRDYPSEKSEDYVADQMIYAYEKIKLFYEKVNKIFKDANNPIQKIYDNVLKNDEFAIDIAMTLKTVQDENDKLIKNVVDFLEKYKDEFLSIVDNAGSFRISDLLLKLDDVLDNDIFDRLIRYYSSARDRRYVASPRAYQRATQKIIESIKEFAPID